MNRNEPIGATLATGGSVVAGVADVNTWLQCLVTLATLAWWVRLWLKDPNVPPPKA